MIILFELALTFYFVSTILGVVELFRGSKAASKGLMVFAVLGFLLHTANIILRFIVSGHIPITNPHEATSFFSWSIVLLFFIVEYKYRIGLLGSFIMPGVFILMLSSSILPRDVMPLSPAFRSSLHGIHTILAFAGGAVFATVCGVGIMYLLQEHFMKSKRFGDLFHRLPSLQILDEANYRLITIGFPLLTLAIVTGALWAESTRGSYFRWDPKEILALVTWFIYALVLHLKLTTGWRGRRAAILSIVGFIGVLFAFLGLIFFRW